jgi:hypothetical protein
MKGFYDIFSQEGPILNKIVFNQQRYIDGIEKTTNTARVVYYPTQITSRMFNLFQYSISYSYLAGLRGIGKSFTIMQYC